LPTFAAKIEAYFAVRMSISESFRICELLPHFLSFLTNIVSHPFEKARLNTYENEKKMMNDVTSAYVAESVVK
jgi:hypothetical protein